MNIDDINALQERINRIALTGASPDIIITPEPEISLRAYVSSYQANKCTILMLYNELQNRSISYPISDNSNITYRDGILGLHHIVAIIANSREELLSLMRYVDIPVELQSITISLFNILSTNIYDITVFGIKSQPIHEYVQDRSSALDFIHLQSIYTTLKGTMNMSGKILSIQSIIGGIMYAYSNIPTASLYNIISRLENESSPYHMNQNKSADALEWYKERLNTKIPSTSISFYENSLTQLMNMPITNISLQIYSPQVDLERLIIRPIETLDMVDVISNARTSSDVPIIVINTPTQKIIKMYNKIETMRKIELSWFTDMKKDTINTMNIIVRISRYPDRYQAIQYNNNKNYFLMNRTEKYISTSELITTLCNHLHIDSLTAPEIANTTYSFITNYIRSGTTNDYGLDRHILAWLITNPPGKYRDMNLHKYVFVKEDTKPNALRDHISIHIQLGTEKLYLTISRHDTTSGTLSSIGDDNLIGFQQGQRYLEVRINKAQNIHYARIAQSIYHHIISMYIEYYTQTRGHIYIMTGVSIPHMKPEIIPLIERVPDLRERYVFQDPILYRYVSNISNTLLPIPIERGDMQYWLDKSYSVMKLPTIVVNNPLITFKTSGEIWIRTPNPGQRFYLMKKEDGGYIPLGSDKQISDTILVTVRNDMMLIDTQIVKSYNNYLLSVGKSLSDKLGRLAHIDNASLELLKPILSGTIRKSSIYRIGINMNILTALNDALSRSISSTTLSSYAYLCLQENWEQSVEEIGDDILNQRIYPMRHFRALEEAFNVNIYFLMEDKIEPYLRKPPHAFFYLHRKGKEDRKNIIFHTLPSEPNVFTLVVYTGETRYRYLFDGTEYLDSLMNQSNIVRMVSPVDGIDERLYTVPINMSIKQYNAVEQVVDAYGKCRGITYQYGKSIATINIGFAPIQNLPVGEIRIPTIQDITRDLGDDIISLILRPNTQSEQSIWSKMERDTRILRIIVHLLYSQMTDTSLDDFFDLIEVQEDIVYDTTQLQHKLPNIQGSSTNAWEYFSDIIPTMVNSDDTVIYVPDEKTKDALYYHVMSTPKIKWPSTFPLYVQYTWDIQTGRDEMVFLRDVDLIQYLIMSKAPREVYTIVVSPIPYILNRGNDKYLIQMASNIDHAKYIAYTWDTNDDGPINPGYESTIYPVEYTMPEVLPDFTEKIYGISYTYKDNRIFVIIPI